MLEHTSQLAGAGTRTLLDRVLGPRPPPSPWGDTRPVRQEMFSVERLEQHAASLAAAQRIAARPPAVLNLQRRLASNAAVLLAVYRANAAVLEAGGEVAPAAEWLLDNYHIVEAQIREIRGDLPPGYYRQLPKLADGPFRGYPRVFGLAWAYVAHSDSYFDPDVLRRYLVAYQQVQPLTIGELWAVAISLRIILVENLRRLADQITSGAIARADADQLADRLLASGCGRSALETDIEKRAIGPLSEMFAARLAKRLRDQDPRTTPALGWLEERLGSAGLTVDEAVQRAQQRQGASNVTMRNIITSMRLISSIDWTDLFESVSLVDRHLKAASAFSAMDFASRNLYRTAIEELARGSPSSELEIARAALEAARSAPPATTPIEDERVRDPGYHLIADGRPAFERQLGFRPKLRLRIGRLTTRLGIGGYIGANLVVTALLLAVALWALAAAGLSLGWLALLALLGFLPASEVAATLVNRTITWRYGAVILPGLELAGGVPNELRTLVAVPTLLTSEASLLEHVAGLEVHYLSGAGGDIAFALLLDGVDADQEEVAGEAPLLAVAASAIADLNLRHGSGAGGFERFFLLHRRRVFSAGEGKWMGWERKRGKLHELNRLLRGATDTTFIAIAGRTPELPTSVRYVITLDADTRLPRDAALRLIGKLAHPLNRPRFDAAGQRVVGGYGILQPRVTPSLPVGREGSFFQRVFSAPGGIDPYAAAVSDVYQDLFGEGSYAGKGIYDVDAFEAALAGRVPENALLSHDLFEGIFARAGLASDIEVIEDFPARYDVAARRTHRWTRGDWQLLPWLWGRRPLPSIGRGKILDNLRRSLLAPFTFLAVGAAWLLPLPLAVMATLFLLATIAIPALLPTVLGVVPQRAGVRLSNHLRTLVGDLGLAAMQSLLALVFLADQAWRIADAVLRTLMRLLWTRRHLLEWTTAAQSSAAPRLELWGFYRRMAGGTVLGLAMAGGALAMNPAAWPAVMPVALLWLAAPAIALWASRSLSASARLTLSRQDAAELRLIARRTWRYFETFVTAADNMLPPDNFQEEPRAVVARRTSPTNIGLYLMAGVAARDFGWAGTTEIVERFEATLATLRKLQRFKGHFFNWYGTADLRPLEPIYVSSVDSGNLAGHLIVLANACEGWLEAPIAADSRTGMLDNLQLARTALDALPTGKAACRQEVATLLDAIAAELHGPQATLTLLSTLTALTAEAVATARAKALHPAANDDNDAAELVFWLQALQRTVAELDRDRLQMTGAAAALEGRLRALAASARALALAMNFAFLVDPERELLSIGYSLVDNCLDPSCYDLLASEARLASLFAIAKGDVPTRHWFRLGRTATPVGRGSALLSWSGSMFEYLMPSLVMRAPAGSLLEQTNRLVVQRQQTYGRTLGVPWGISEAAYNVRDLEFTYQYSNFGVPGLGLKRGLAENVVIAPYATGLSAMVDPHGALENFRRMSELGAECRYGFVEALDFTRSRLPEGVDVAIIRTVMAHHQGMTIVAIANTLHDGQMRARFHREPMIQACELLLQERMPRDVAIAHPRAEEVKAAASVNSFAARTVRRIDGGQDHGAPLTHLLSNGRYAVMLTAAGAGYSRWRDIAVTRWREDATSDPWGSFVYLKDIESGEIWSAGGRPVGSPADHRADHRDVVFAEDFAEFTCRHGKLVTTMDVIVSGEDDGEVRRVSLANGSRRPRLIELTSFAELVLTTQAADNAHPAFAKMFVQTAYACEYAALIATRRRRSPDEPEVWAAHFSVVEGDSVGEQEYESDRARFIGRCRTVGDALAMTDGRPLSGTVGTVLDPIFAIRRRIRVASGKVARVAFWTVVAATRTELFDLIDQHHDRSAFDRAKTLAWTQAQVQLRHLGVEADEAADFQRLTGPILYADLRFRAPSDAIIRGAGPQSGLWPHGISGDLPIVLLRIDDGEDMDRVRQLLRAHEYWRMKRLGVDLVIINERASSYVQDLQIAIETAVRRSQSRQRLGDELAQGSVYVLRADLMSADARLHLRAVARVSLVARRGKLSDQFTRMQKAPRRTVPLRASPVGRPRPIPGPAARQPPPDLEFFNGLGGFALDGREYVTILGQGQSTPAPWINVIANPAFGFQVSAAGSGYTWSLNSRENQLTPWSNDPVGDPAGEAFYVRDEATGELWSPTAMPIRGDGTYSARHGFGYSRFAHEAHGIALDLLQYVPLDDPLKISRLTLENRSGRPRRLSVTAYAEWVMGTSRGATAPFVITSLDAATGAVLARNPWSTAFAGRVAFADLLGRQTSWTADRTHFLGAGGNPAAPAALLGGQSLGEAIGAGLDPCAALQCVVELAPGERVEVVALMGQDASAEAASALVARYRETDLDAVLDAVGDHWQTMLGAVQVTTPDRAMDIMLNGWLLYQTLACRIWARSAFYQASGAYGFRDQLQDGMALTFADPAATRGHLLRAASRQFVEGDVQHWWLPHTGQGVRTRISDDRVWLAFATATYVESAGDAAILDEVVTFLEGQALAHGEHDAFFQPMIAGDAASLFEHCARGLDQCLTLTGAQGLPLIGTGDWNDGMNRVGQDGCGESVWLGWLLWRTLTDFGPLADTRDPERARRWRDHAANLHAALERVAWDGDWYRRATLDDGTWLGSKDSDECQIDSIAQSWAVLSSAAEPARATRAMAALDRLLIRQESGLALLFTPPFDQTRYDPGYIKGYPPGLRENGGQYSHAAMWAILAFAKLGDGDKAAALFALLNPINHSRTRAAVERYKVEPYVVAADVYSVAPHEGRGGWTWYTGSAGWMYRAGIEGILGIRRVGGELIVEPCLPAAWPGFEAEVRVASTHYEISVTAPAAGDRPTSTALLDGAAVAMTDGCLRVPLDGGTHRLSLAVARRHDHQRQTSRP